MWLGLLLACTGTDDSAETAVDPLCVDAPIVTYETFGAGFVEENCQSCHASTSLDRQGAPSFVVFDTVDDVWALDERILQVAVPDPPMMPPQGGTTADDRAKLEIWLTCAEMGT
ncbi:MAG: hypothetical protein Q8P18_14385 [Pseudomonadota bacterium]|nr:hypothetical protein [Pseudomonadota bacterium]